MHKTRRQQEILPRLIKRYSFFHIHSVLYVKMVIRDTCTDNNSFFRFHLKKGNEGVQRAKIQT